MPAQLRTEGRAAYRALMRVVLAGPRAVGAEIAPDFGLGFSDHLALQRLSESPDGQMRMVDLAAACGVLGSGINMIIRRLADEGLATRARSSEDAGGAYAVLTPRPASQA